jgi:membrane-bound lytic murein transglycosylase B
MRKMITGVRTLSLVCIALLPLHVSAGYDTHPDAKLLIESLQADGFDPAYVSAVLAKAERKQSILDAISRPAEKRLDWGGYRAIFIEPKRIAQGVEFWNEHKETLLRAEQTFGVPAEIILAIMGVETRYGRITGSFRVLDALATLGFDYPRRAEFFRKQLADYFRLVRQEGADPESLKGSYAGAMGYGQFIPSSYLAYAIDFDGDGKRDIWGNPVDAIGSIANYFAEHNWRKGEPVISNVVFNSPVQEEWVNQDLKPERTIAQWQAIGVGTNHALSDDMMATVMRFSSGDEDKYLMGLHNFYVITRYNHSRLYANAVYELSQLIKEQIK